MSVSDSQAEAPPPSDEALDEASYDPATLAVTHHCLARWLERVHGVDLTAARNVVSGTHASKHVDNRVIKLIEKTHGLDLEPLRDLIRREIAGSDHLVLKMAKKGGIRTLSATTPDGRCYVVMRTDKSHWYVRTMLDPGMTAD